MEYKILNAIIRKPQEGKTFICLKSIEKQQGVVHLIVTMNTIKSNLQFFTRANNTFNGNLCVFNSKKNIDYNHVKSVSELKQKIKEGIEIVIMCAHNKRLKESILELLDELSDSKTFSKKIIIHIDEAHAYVPSYRDQIVKMNDYELVDNITLYSATPFEIWMDTRIKSHPLFHNIYIVNEIEQYGIMKSPEYFGVKDTIHFINRLPFVTIEKEIPRDFILKYGDDTQKTSSKIFEWYSEQYPFSLGNELIYLSYIKYILSSLKGRIKENKFSYNFVPSYKRKLTQYQIMVYILEIYCSAIVIIINGKGAKGYTNDNYDGSCHVVYNLPQNNEPSEQIYSFIKQFPSRPVFITGFDCVNMSVTLINQKIGNFDNVIFDHMQYINTPSTLYQLCRFAFNYSSWESKNKQTIKKTNIFVNNSECFQTCLDYEKQIDNIDEMKGSIRTKEEVVGDVKIKEPRIPKERKFSKLEIYSKTHKTKYISVDEDTIEEQFSKMCQIYKEWTGKDISGKSMPKKNKLKQDFYECSTTGKCEIQYNVSDFKKKIKNWKWDSNFQITKNKSRYCRVYVVYDDETDPYDYTWVIRRMEIDKCPKVEEFWEDLCISK